MQRSGEFAAGPPGWTYGADASTLIGGPMLISVKARLIALSLAASAVTFTAVPAEAVTDYANCDAMHRVYKYGVAKSKAAADKQYRTGHYRPAVRPLVYRANSESDADHDGTACEVTR